MLYPQMQLSKDGQASFVSSETILESVNLRRWGKKMAVVIDKAFAESLWPMRRAKHISNADIAWFIVAYSDSEQGKHSLRRHDVVLTTLEDAVEGLTGGVPVTLDEFETSIREKLSRH
ncbi:MAG: NotI family restriction endonuclease [Nitrospiraceae bacterium]